MTDDDPAGAAFNRTLLLVEDDPALNDYLANALGQSGYQVLRAFDRRQAIQLLQGAELPGIALMDLGLPPHASGMSEGLTLLDDYLLRVPQAKAIVLTGQDEDSAAFEAVRRGAFDFLTKPVGIPEIIRALDRARLFSHNEQRLTAHGETRLHLTARLSEGPKEAAAGAEEQLLRRIFVSSGYNVAETARRLGLAREHVYYYLRKYGVRRPD
ncbi:MAG: response regulator [Rhodoferax sp.]|nr:response regulator [Rhodoferax sp.]